MTILITGGVSGLGRAITMNLAADPQAKLLVTYNRSVAEAEKLCAEFPNVNPVKCNFQDKDDMDRLLNLIGEEEIDVLINNAFTGMRKEHFHKTDPAWFLNSFSVNVLSTIMITQKAIELFRARNSGRIITVLSSFIVNRPPTGLSVYVAEKNYLFSLAKSWAVENARFNISSNMVSPAYMQTQLNQDTDERVSETMRAKLPLKKFLTPENAAEAVRFLVYCTPQINGHNILINQAEDLQ